MVSMVESEMYGNDYHQSGVLYNARSMSIAQASSSPTAECEVEKSSRKEGQSSHRDWLTVAEAAERADVSQNTVKNWVMTYGIGIKVGGRFRIQPDKLDDVLRGVAVKR